MLLKFKRFVFCLTVAAMIIFSTSHAFGEKTEISIKSRIQLTELTMIAGYGVTIMNIHKHF